MKYINLIILFILVFFIAMPVFATLPMVLDNTPTFNNYRNYKDITVSSIQVPTVVEVPFNNEQFERFDFAVSETYFSSLLPSYFIREAGGSIPVSAISSVVNSHSMVDGNSSTYAEFNVLRNDGLPSDARITISSTKQITSSSLTILLDNNVALPSTIEIRANGKIVIAKKRLSSTRINFPRTTSNSWEITFTYIQPLRISELRLAQENSNQTTKQALRFLAQPGQSYRIYFNPDKYVRLTRSESGDLSNNKDVLLLGSVPTIENLSYIQADIDNDSIADIYDNCISVSNTDQVDIDNNGRGDVCDDFDKDGLINSKDNCPNNPNRDQKDIDSDGVGDVCDGEESRITEKYPWIPWAGMGIAVLVLVILFVITAKGALGKKEEESIDNTNSETPPDNNIPQ